MKISFSIDDGCTSDIRIAKLLKKYKIPAVFYWPIEWRSLAHEKGYKPLTFEEATYIAKEFEVGSHTVTHRLLTKLPIDEACIEIAESKQILAEMFDQEIPKFAPPRGYTNPELTHFTMKMYQSQRLTVGPNLVHIHPDSGANDNLPWQTRFAEVAKDQKEIELWCHSWELDKFGLWEELEEFLDAYIHSKL